MARQSCFTCFLQRGELPFSTLPIIDNTFCVVKSGYSCAEGESPRNGPKHSVYMETRLRMIPTARSTSTPTATLTRTLSVACDRASPLFPVCHDRHPCRAARSGCPARLPPPLREDRAGGTHLRRQVLGTGHSGCDCPVERTWSCPGTTRGRPRGA